MIVAQLLQKKWITTLAIQLFLLLKYFCLSNVEELNCWNWNLIRWLHDATITAGMEVQLEMGMKFKVLLSIMKPSRTTMRILHVAAFRPANAYVQTTRIITVAMLTWSTWTTWEMPSRSPAIMTTATWGSTCTGSASTPGNRPFSLTWKLVAGQDLGLKDRDIRISGPRKVMISLSKHVVASVAVATSRKI